jgi:hypothetical protein
MTSEVHWTQTRWPEKSDLDQLNEHGHCLISCSRCDAHLARLYENGGHPRVFMKFGPSQDTYRSRQRVPLFCRQCRRRYASHTPHSLLRRVRAGFDAKVPY